ncbi:uncharacterized protein LOC119719459 [Patiria miniata]|uniref:Fe2OG dioxygenase domain-containing protein n=1 Tax=Patiria miniata TaxID=46514 RepID=A0A913YZ64_PATMI|nr:uncharacterized protein LOC119719459 [Patiria miniata]
MAKTPAKHRKNVKPKRNSSSSQQHSDERPEVSGKNHSNYQCALIFVILATGTVVTLGIAVIMRAGPDSNVHITTDDAEISLLKRPDQKESHSLPEKADKNVGTSEIKETEHRTNGLKQSSAHNHPKEFQETILKQLKPRDITVDGRLVKVQELIGSKKRPEKASIRVYQFEHFLSDQECDGLMRAHLRHVSVHSEDPIICFDSVDTLRRHLRNTQFKNMKITSEDFTEGTTCVNASFSKDLKSILGWSTSTAFYPGETKFTSIFDERVYRATELKPSNGGKYQITSYRNGIGYKTHTDCTIGNRDLRDRMGTILVYLQDVEEGGQTEFPELGISVRPRKGRAITWNNEDIDGTCDPYSIHAAKPVIKGHKIILQRWYYYQNFYMLGKRPSSEPDLPVRQELQPYVSCDEYDHGSCRWYDEWGYDHLVQYRQVKKQLH